MTYAKRSIRHQEGHNHINIENPVPLMNKEQLWQQNTDPVLKICNS